MNAKQKRQKQIESAIKVIQEALVDRFGDAASNAGPMEGCWVEIRASGVDVIDSESAPVVSDDTKAAARYLAGETN